MSIPLIDSLDEQLQKMNLDANSLVDPNASKKLNKKTFSNKTKQNFAVAFKQLGAKENHQNQNLEILSQVLDADY